MQFETSPALPGHLPRAGRVLRLRLSQPGSKSSDLNFRIAKKCFDNPIGIDRLFLAQVNVDVPFGPKSPASGQRRQCAGTGAGNVQGEFRSELNGP